MIIFTSYEKEWQTNLNSLCRCATYRRKVVVAKDKNKRPYFRYHLPAKGNTVDSDLCSNSTAVWNKIKLLTLACFALWEYNTETWCILNGWLHRWAFPTMWCTVAARGAWAAGLESLCSPAVHGKDALHQSFLMGTHQLSGFHVHMYS